MSLFSTIYDVIVIGGGHAGSEAAAASANMGAHTLLITMNLQNIAQMSCNPAMGGIAKGQIVREIDALGGYSGIVTDKTAIQFKMLNKSKGPAMWSPRVQSDRMQFAECWRTMLEETENLDFYQDSVNGLFFDGNKIVGVKTALGLKIKSKTVIITAGTFLNGLIHIGEKTFGGGRAGEGASTGITEDLVRKGFESGRMKTGTPPRVDGRSLDYSKMIEQPGDEKPEKFSYLPSTKALSKQRSCYLTYTNQKVHDLLREGFDRSPMFNGRIKATGPRYCPSIEDKIDRFATKDRHQIFVEPEGWTTVEMYVNGFSTSLPEDIQDKAIRSIEGFKNVKFFRYGYAIEYDYFPPTQLTHSLETKIIENLFFAGQINGTTGYEEAAAQGLMAGVNAALKTQEKEPFILKRNEAYIGVLIDDLITKGTEEPYRMFTSRAEYRTLLRQDNADLRLTPRAFKIGLASKERMERVLKKQQKTDLLINFLDKTSVKEAEINPILASKNLALVNQSMKLFKIAARPQLSFSDFINIKKLNSFMAENNIDKEVIEQVEIHLKYSGY
ncbi:MAG: tRNA uridine-5-carboxymethylaminomethyl(34) synthesis enzyme MnmG, partial [Polaribacter sp.]